MVYHLNNILFFCFQTNEINLKYAHKELILNSYNFYYGYYVIQMRDLKKI